MTGHHLLDKLAAAGVPSAKVVESLERTFDADLIPELPAPTGPLDDGLSDALDPLTVVEAYNRWVNKGLIEPGKRNESIKVRCPSPNHVDNNPSAWIRLDKGEGGVGNCAQCGGFDKFTIYAWNHGLTPAGAKIGNEYPQVRRAMAEELGWVVGESGGSKFLVGRVGAADETPSGEDEEPQGGDTPEAPSAVASVDVSPEGEAGGAGSPPAHPLLEKLREHTEPPKPKRGRPRKTIDPSKKGSRVERVVQHDPDAPSDESRKVVSIETGLPVDPTGLLPTPEVDWESLVPEGTFLDAYMSAVTPGDDIPHEFYLFGGLMALGAACGRNVYFDERVRAYPNLLVVLFGDTSTGKSRSLWPLQQVLAEAVPFEEGDEWTRSSGVKWVGSVGSGESLIRAFSDIVLDPSTMEPAEFHGHNGIAKIEEFSMAAAVGRRSGSTFKEFLMQLYDSGSVRHSSLASGVTQVDDAFMQIVSTTQPDAVQEFLRRYDTFSGYLNRWIMVMGRNRLGRNLSMLPPPVNLNNAVAALKEVHAWAGTERPMIFEGEAYELWDNFFQGVVPSLQEQASPLLARWDLNMKKIILLLTANEMLDTPSVEIVEKVISQIFPWMRWVYTYFEERMVLTEDERIINEALAYIERHYERKQTWPTIRDMKKSGVGKKYGAKPVIDTCEWGAKAGLIVKATNKQTTRYALAGDGVTG